MSNTLSTDFRRNHFDLIRLIAAFQVVIWHSIEHFIEENNFTILLKKILAPIPGVPIFFVISGYLIYTSYERNSSLRKYLTNRCLRIFPGLWAVYLLTVIILAFLGYIIPNLFNPSFWIWSFSQISIFQFYTPDFLRAFGVGTPNGSLWTIFIEFSFYLFIPLLFLIKKNNTRIYVILFLIFISICYNHWYNQNFRIDGIETTIFQKLLGLNLLPYLFYFLIGVWIKIDWSFFSKYLVGKGYIWVSSYLLYYLLFSVILNKYEVSYWPNFYGLLSTLLLLFAVISIAFTSVGSKRLLNGIDLSYGIYLYHMPLINLGLSLGFFNNIWALVLIFLATILISVFSWFTIEKPALNLK